MPVGADDYTLPQLVQVGSCDSLRESKLPREDRWYSDLIGFDIDVGRND